MSIGVGVRNYADRAAEYRDKYNDALNEIRGNYKRDVEARRNSYEASRKNQKKNYLRDRAESEERFARTKDRYDKTLRNSIERSDTRHRKKLDGARERYRGNLMDAKGSYDRKLDNVSNSYRRSMDDMEHLHSQEKGRLNKRLLDGLNRSEENFDRRLKEISEHNRSNVIEMAKDNEDSKRKLSSDYYNDKSKMLRDFNDEKSDLKDTFREEKRAIVDGHKQRVSQINSRNKNNLANIRLEKEREVDTIRDNFNRAGAKETREQKELVDGLRRKNKENVHELDKKLRNQKDAWNRQMESLLSLESGQTSDNPIDAVKHRYQGRIDQLKKKINSMHYDNHQSNTQMADNYKDEIRDLQIKHSIDMRTKDEVNNRDMKRRLGSLKSKNQNAIEKYQERYRQVENRLNAESIKSKSKLKNAVKNINEEYSRRLELMDESNKGVVEGFKEQLADEQSKFFTDVRRRSHEAQDELKHELKNRYEVKENSLLDKISSQKLERERLIDMYEDRIKRITDKSAENARIKSDMMEESKSAREREFRSALSASKRNFEAQNKIMKRDFDKHVSKLHQENSRKIRNLNNKYEDLMSRQREVHMKALRDAKQKAKIENDRLLQKSELERTSLINQFEARLESIKDTMRS